MGYFVPISIFYIDVWILHFTKNNEINKKLAIQKTPTNDTFEVELSGNGKSINHRKQSISTEFQIDNGQCKKKRRPRPLKKHIRKNSFLKQMVLIIIYICTRFRCKTVILKIHIWSHTHNVLVFLEMCDS